MNVLRRIFLVIAFVPLLSYAEDGPTIDGSGTTNMVQSKQIWAQSYLWAKAPELVVESWLTPEPDTHGKFVLIEFWATWCSACRRAQPLMNTIHDKYGDEMVIIGISDEPGNKVIPYIKSHNIQYHMAVDTKARMKDALGIWGIPHVIIIEPGGYVIWEGFPLLKGYELTEMTIQKILEIGRGQKQ